MTILRRFRQAERTASRVIEGAAYVVAVDRQVMLELNEVGTLVWELLSAPATLPALVARVAEEFEVTPDEAGRDVESFLEVLLARGVVVEEAVAA